MTTHLDGLAAVARVITDHPVAAGAAVQVSLWGHSRPRVDLSLHQTPGALTDALTGALGLTEADRYLQRDGVGTVYRVRCFDGGNRDSATFYGPRLSRQAWRTSSRADVQRVSA